MSTPLPEELDLLREIILPAGQLLLAEQGRTWRVDYKSATELVTDLDRRVEQLLVEHLARLFPDDAIYAEEGTENIGRSGRSWYLDPLDGTTNYVHGHPFFAISLGCVQDDTYLLGAVYAPYLDELYLGARDWGAQLERPHHEVRLPLAKRSPVTLERALLATGFPYVRDETVAQIVAILKRFLLAQCHGVRRAGSAAIDLCHVAAGKLDGYWEMKLRPWDVVAGTLIAREAGVVVTDFSAKAGFLAGEQIVAALPGLHSRMLAVIQDVMREFGGDVSEDNDGR
jgi:myo-inositol-1(or 4)-monophosphatase